jgi:hypothetical protein
MKGSTRAATALAVGYLLGRRRKFRTAVVMAAATAAGGSSVGGMVMRQGTKMLGSSEALGKVAPQVGDLVDIVRGDLLSAGKAAVTAAASNRVDALTDSLHERAERMRNTAGAVAEGAEGATREAGRAASAAGGRAASAGGRAASAAGGTARRASRVTGRGRADDEYEDDKYEDDKYEDEEPEEPEYEEAEGVTDDQDEYPADDADSDDEQEAAGRGRRAGNGRRTTAPGRGGARRSPVSRTGR